MFALRFISVAVLLGLSSCAVGPNFNRPSAPHTQGYSQLPLSNHSESAAVHLGEIQTFNEAADIPSDWWTLFQSKPINSLIERALKQNPTIESAQAALTQMQAYADAQRGYFFPSVGLSYSGSRNKIAGNLSSSAPGPQANGDVIQSSSPQPTYYNFHVTQLNISFVPDFFGLNRRQVESANALVALQKFQLEAAQISLASNIFAAAVQQALLRDQINSVEKITGLNQESMEILNSQLKHGYVSELDVAAQENLLATAQQQLISLKLQMQKNKNLIAALQGNFSDEETPERFDLSLLQLPQDLPLSVPSKLVEQRPDVRAAEEQLHYASAQAGVAVANQFPQFNILGVAGGMADQPNWMFKAGGSFFNPSTNISEILFDGGVLRAKSRAARSALAQAGAEYRSTVITAVQNVADTIATLQSDAEILQAAAAAEKAAETALKINRKQYQLGAMTYQTLLAAQQVYEVSVINLNQAQASRLLDTAALYQALGGGWWNRNKTNNVSSLLDNTNSSLFAQHASK